MYILEDFPSCSIFEFLDIGNYQEKVGAKEQKAEIKEAFDLFDTDGTGTIEAIEPDYK